MISEPALTLSGIDALTDGKLGTFDVACPMCGPARRAVINRKRKVMRIWRLEPGFASFHCARCGEKGHTRDASTNRPDPAAFARARAEAAERERVAVGERLAKALWLWRQRKPVKGSLVETYLRSARGYAGALPATIGYLPARGEHGPGMIAAFGLAGELEPGELRISDSDVRGVHITRLAQDGSGKAGTPADKIMLGTSLGFPIVLAPPNDLLGLVIAEGIEDAFSVHEATGLGAWAAGSASRLPALASALPAYIECVTIMVDDDLDGRRHAAALADALSARRIEVRRILLASKRAAA